MSSKCALGTPGHEEGVENESEGEWGKGLVRKAFIDDRLPIANLLFPKINSFSETPSAFG